MIDEYRFIQRKKYYNYLNNNLLNFIIRKLINLNILMIKTKTNIFKVNKVYLLDATFIINL